jgi:hypothetical protein
MSTGGSFPGVKRPGRVPDQSPPSSAEVKNDGAKPPLPHVFSWHSAYLIKHRGNFTFFTGMLIACFLLDAYSVHCLTVRTPDKAVSYQTTPRRHFPERRNICL